MLIIEQTIKYILIVQTKIKINCFLKDIHVFLFGIFKYYNNFNLIFLSYDSLILKNYT